MHSSGYELPPSLGRGTLVGLSPACIPHRHCSATLPAVVSEFREYVLSELAAAKPLKSTRETAVTTQPSAVLSEVVPAFFGLR